MKRLTSEEKYNYLIRQQRKQAEEFIENEEFETDYIFSKYRHSGIEMPLDIYRACAFFLNKEYKMKLGSIALLIQTKEHLIKELPEVTKENCFDQICYKYQVYSKVLEQGGF
ncbi:hypothetical protein FACS1894190_15170 [Spirochaetia bacterium]|nr:hypothetical protein FACS1894190_15170 [Spirochaetia bacterium]